MTDKQIENIARSEYEKIPLKEKEKLVSVYQTFILAFKIAYKYLNKEKQKCLI